MRRAIESMSNPASDLRGRRIEARVATKWVMLSPQSTLPSPRIGRTIQYLNGTADHRARDAVAESP